MARSWMPLVASILALVIPCLSGAPAPAPASVGVPTPALDCQSMIYSDLVGCLNYVINNNTEKVPSKDCCSGLSTVVENNAVCLCTLFGGNDSTAADLGVNRTQALQLPAACHVSTPDPSLCSLVTGAPVPSAGGPVSESGSTEEQPSVSKSAASSFRTTAGVLLAGLCVAIVAYLCR